MTDARQTNPPNPLFATVGDAAFLACSWTWCIGMFLPVLLLRDMGVGSFLVFAIPNCLGAAAFAWWMRDAETSKAFVRVHARPIRLFSYITIAFQWFFGAWMLRGLGLSVWTLGVIAAGASVFFLLPTNLLDDAKRRLVSVIVWVVSVALLVGWAVTNPADATLDKLPDPLLKGDGHLGPLLGVCMFGFMLCPLFDGTFHLVMQRTAKPKATFSLGFLIMFAAMIAGTLFYGAYLVRDGAQQQANLAPAGLPWAVIFHIAIQLAYTLAVHERSVSSIQGWNDAGAKPNATFIAAIVGMVLAILSAMPQIAAVVVPKNVDMSMSEMMYRVFMVFYGLFFPVMVLGCCMPFGKRTPGVTRPRSTLVIMGSAGAVVSFQRGFIDRDTPMLWIGLGIAIACGTIAAALAGPDQASGGQPPQSGGPVPAPRDPTQPVLSASEEER